MNNNIGQKLIEQIKLEVTQLWFAAVKERDQKRKAELLAQYRESKRRYEAQQMLAA